MKQLVVGIVVLVTAVVLTWYVVEDPGYVVLARDPWRVEIALSLFVLLFLCLLVGLYIFLRFLSRLWQSPKILKRWRRQKQFRNAQRSMINGSLRLIEGDWKKAEKQLVDSLHDSSNPVLGYLAAAYSANSAGNKIKRDEYVAQASREFPKEKLAIGLVHAHLQYRSGELALACETLQKLQANGHRNIQVLRLLANAYVDLKRWQEILQLLPLLRRMEAFTTQALDEYELQACCSLLVIDEKGDPAQALDGVWASFSPKLRHQSNILAAYVEALMGLGKDDQCETLIRSAVNRQWNGKLVYLYGKLNTNNSIAQFKIAETWSLNHAVDPDLLLTLGRLAIKNKLWGKARSYLETCIASKGPVEAFDELGRLLEQLGETQKALACYRQGLEKSVNTNDRSGEIKPDVDLTSPNVRAIR